MPALFVLGVILVALVALYGYWAKKKRREDLAAVAARLGFQYSQEDPFELLGLPFALFRMGDDRGVENVIWGEHAGMQIREFDYWYYDTRSDAEGHTRRDYSRFSCAVSPISPACPHLSVGREGFFTRLADALGFHDIEFESEEFNRAFQVKASERKFASALIDARMMEWLLHSSGGCTFETQGHLLLTSIGRLRPAEIPNLLATLRGFRDHIPAVVQSLYPGT